MAFPGDYTLLGTLKVPPITGTSTNIPLLIKYEDFTSEMLSKLDAGLGDFRLSDDEGGNNQLALQVVTGVKSSGGIQVWYKEPSAVTGQLVYVWGDNTGDSQPAANSTYGSEAVWADYAVVLHGNDFTDSTGNHTFTEVGTTSHETGQLGSSLRVNKDNYLTASPATKLDTALAGDFSVSCWFSYPAFPFESGQIIGQGPSTSGSWFTYGIRQDDPTIFIDDSSSNNASSGDFDVDTDGTTGTFYNLGIVKTGTTRQHYEGGSTDGSLQTETTGDASSTKNLNIGGPHVLTGDAQLIDVNLVQIYIGEKSANYIATENSNQSSGPTTAWFTATNASTSADTLYSLNITSKYLQRSETLLSISSEYKELLESVFNISSKYLERSSSTLNISSAYSERLTNTINIESAYQQRQINQLNIASAYTQRLTTTLSIESAYVERYSGALNITSVYLTDSSDTIYTLNIASKYLARSIGTLNIQSDYKERLIDSLNITSSYKQLEVNTLSIDSAYLQREQSTLNITSGYQERFTGILVITTKYNGEAVTIRLTPSVQVFITEASNSISITEPTTQITIIG
jgi:hypothetical protein